MGWYGSAMTGWGWVLMGLFWLVLIAVVVVLVARLLPGSPPRTRAADAHESALDTLDRRLAEGDIDLRTYQAQRAAIIANARTRR